MKRKVCALGIAAVITIVIAGCGPRKATLDIELSDFKFTPSTWSVPAGAEVTLNVKNSGTLEHEWVLMKKGEEAATPWAEHTENEEHIFFEVETEPGASQSVTFEAPTDPGDYQIVCGTAGHIEKGMVGTLTVTP